MANISIDIDGVLADFNTSFQRILHNLEPNVECHPLQLDFPNCWNWPQAYGYSPAAEAKAWTEVKNSGTFWYSLFPYASAWDDLQLLNVLRKEHDIYFVTTRVGRSAKGETEAWLNAHGFSSPTVIISDQKGLFSEAVGINLIVDDRPENLLKQPFKTRTVLVKRPYNQGYWDYFNKTVSTIREALSDL